MRKHLALLAIVVSIAFAAAQKAASAPAPALADQKTTSEPAAPTKLIKPAQTPASRPRGHTFQVNDEKGLLLTCVAPELDTNPDTDVFKSCALAPGRTLDDVMHTFIGAIHFEQNQQAKERAEWYKELEERSAQKPTQK